MCSMHVSVVTLSTGPTLATKALDKIVVRRAGGERGEGRKGGRGGGDTQAEATDR